MGLPCFSSTSTSLFAKTDPRLLASFFDQELSRVMQALVEFERSTTHLCAGRVRSVRQGVRGSLNRHRQPDEPRARLTRDERTTGTHVSLKSLE